MSLQGAFSSDSLPRASREGNLSRVDRSRLTGDGFGEERLVVIRPGL